MENGDKNEPNPVTQIILTRTAQVGIPSLAALLLLQKTLPPERFAPLVPWWGIATSAALSAYFVATFHARTPLFFAGGEPLWVRLPPAPQKRIALTFDDGPYPETTPRLLDVLAQAGAKATFFVVGEQAARCQDLIRRIVDEGHTLGLHGMRHRTMVLQNARALTHDLRQGQKVLETAIGQPLTAKLLRPPYGFKSGTLARVAAREEWKIVSWSLDPRDYDSATAAVISGRIFQRATPGDVVLLHERATNSVTASALPEILRDLAERGFICAAL